MKHETFLRVAFAAALLFGANIGAQAQFGGLKGLANKAKKAVKEKVEGNQQTTEGANANSVSPSASESTSPSTQSQTSSNVQQDAAARYRASHPDQAEAYNAEQAGGMDKYLGLDQTENGRILWKYADMSPNESQKSSNLGNAKMAARHIVEVLRYLKGNTERFSQYDNQTHTLDVLNNTVGEEIKGMAAKGAGKSPLPQADINALKAECARVKQLYLEAKGGKEKSASEVKAEADSKYIQDIAKQNYLLNDLTDKNRNAKAVADYKAKINAKVKSQLAPTKILGTTLPRSPGRASICPTSQSSTSSTARCRRCSSRPSMRRAASTTSSRVPSVSPSRRVTSRTAHSPTTATGRDWRHRWRFPPTRYKANSKTTNQL
jgi:hypothetical protein